MFEHAKILERIEKLVEQLPYQSVLIEIEIDGQTLQLKKDKKRKIGFAILIHYSLLLITFQKS